MLAVGVVASALVGMITNSAAKGNPMWEIIGGAAGMLVLMLMFALIPIIFDLPDAIAKYFSRRSRQPAAGLSPHDPDEAAARVLGEGLRQAELSPEAAAQLMTAFWAADAENRRTLAHLVAGMATDGPIDDESALLAVLRGLPAAAATSEGKKNPRASTAFQTSPETAKGPS
jgi:uncharacterized membrane protein